MSGDFIQRGGLWVLGQSVVLCGVVVGGLLFRDQWASSSGTLCGVLLLLVSAGCALAGALSAWAGTSRHSPNLLARPNWFRPASTD